MNTPIKQYARYVKRLSGGILTGSWETIWIYESQGASSGATEGQQTMKARRRRMTSMGLLLAMSGWAVSLAAATWAVYLTIRLIKEAGKWN